MLLADAPEAEAVVARMHELEVDQCRQLTTGSLDSIHPVDLASWVLDYPLPDDLAEAVITTIFTKYPALFQAAPYLFKFVKTFRMAEVIAKLDPTAVDTSYHKHVLKSMRLADRRHEEYMKIVERWPTCTSRPPRGPTRFPTYDNDDQVEALLETLEKEQDIRGIISETNTVDMLALLDYVIGIDINPPLTLRIIDVMKEARPTFLKEAPHLFLKTRDVSIAKALAAIDPTVVDTSLHEEKLRTSSLRPDIRRVFEDIVLSLKI